MRRKYRVTQETGEEACTLCSAYGSAKKQNVVKVIDLSTNKRQWRCAGHVEDLDPKMAERLRPG